jgi:sulfatase modifying factor 1
MSLADPGARVSFDDSPSAPLLGDEDHPMTLVAWFGARAYYNHHGRRTPSEAEWEKGTHGVDGRPYPWESGVTAAQADDYSPHDLSERIVGGLANTSPVGLYNGGTQKGFETLPAASPHGLHRVAGNLWQWTGNVCEATDDQYLRGGSRANNAHNLRVWTRTGASPDCHPPGTGFRCRRDPSS